MSDSGDLMGGVGDSKFRLEVAALSIFGGLVILVIGPVFVGYWLGVGALAGAVYWTLIYDERLDGVRRRVPAERATMLIGFLYIIVVVELVDGDALRSSLIAGFIVGFVVAGGADTLQRRLRARLEE
jgi:hypothetical protein